ncbi:MAG: T9SS type A sorting domain-containing protein [Bacteroidetes bacterium]|nr:T9SS type A sorting domain-containing protein [Bacteroidota bacterium]
MKTQYHKSLILNCYCISLSAHLFISTFSFSQPYYIRTDTIPVYNGTDTLKFPWVGGHNFCQFSDIDLNFDGIKDLFVFDRTGNKITTYLNGGTPNKVDYTHAQQYQSQFPHLESWVLLIDYNCDGLKDIFTYNYAFPSGIRVYKNVSTSPNLQFSLVKTNLSDFGPLVANIYTSPQGLPAIDDIDGDGDLDVLVFLIGGWTVDYHINKSQEMGYGCDSLIFQLDTNGCWGNFTESSASCTAVLSSCRMGNQLQPDNSNPIVIQSPYKQPNDNRTALDNGGSCLLCLDMDADGDKEFYLGQLGCCTPSFLTNGGTPSAANMTSVTNNFPAGSTPINITSFPCAYFVDVNNDNKRDLIVSPSSPSGSINNESIWYYENTGTDNAPVFIRKNRKLFQDEMIDVGEGADPVFFDFDNDGLTDLLISNYDVMRDSCPFSYKYNVTAYKNNGTLSSPEFNFVTADYANLSSLLPASSSKHLTFGDVDGDGDADMFIGDYDGKIHYFQNTGNTGPAVFTTLPVLNYPDNTGTPIDIGSNATPQLIDADRDGDLDLIIGERTGNINYYKNIGTSTTPSYSLVTTSFGGVDVLKPCCTGYSVPFMYDSAGSYRMIIGSEANRNYPLQGWLWYYKNIDGNLNGNFTYVDSMYMSIWEGMRMTVTGKDITGDGLMDLVIGNYCGGVAFYLGDTTTTSIAEINSPTFDFSIYPNPTNGQIQVISNQYSVIGIEIHNMLGEKVYTSPITDYRLPITIDLSSQPNGIYFCKVTGEKFSRTKKLILIR